MPKKKMLVSCNMPGVGMSAFFCSSSCQRRFSGQNRGEIRFAKQFVTNCENSVFRVIYVGGKNLGSGPFPRDGRVTGNKHLFV